MVISTYYTFFIFILSFTKIMIKWSIEDICMVMITISFPDMKLENNNYKNVYTSKVSI